MPTSIETTTDLIRDAAAHRVYLKESWSESWVEEPHLYCTWLTFCAAPQIATAALHWQYGPGMRQGEHAFSDVAPLDKLQYWVKIEIDQPVRDGFPGTPVVWYGRLDESSLAPDGPKFRESVRVPRGTQTLVAYGLAAILDRQIITTCWVEDEDAGEKELGRALAVNESSREKNRPNRSATHGPRGPYIFSSARDCETYWSTRQILDYLLTYHGPVDHNGNDSIKLVVDYSATQYVPTWDQPVVELHGRTLKQVLDGLFDRRRLLTYAIDDVELGAGWMGEDAIVIRPLTFADVSIALPSGAVWSANADQVSLDFDRAVDIDEASLHLSASQTYDQIVAVGDRVLCCGTMAYLDNTLTRYWTADQQTAYNAGASGEADYAALEECDKQRRNNDYRSSDDLQQVYSYFGLPEDWDGRVGDGVGGELVTLFPFDELGVDANQVSVWYPPALRLERYIPYEVTAGEKDEHRRPYALLKLKDETAEGENRYGQVELLATNAAVEFTGDGEGRKWCCNVRTQDDAPGIVLRVSGAPQHAIAYTDFTAPDDTDEDLGRFDYRDNLLCTFAMRADYYLQAKWPATMAPVGDAARIMRIDAGDKTQAHWVAKGTVTGLEDGELQKVTAGEFLRDDREWLQDLARIAWEWYGTPRQAFSLSYRQASGLFFVGDLVTTIGAGETLESVRTLITEVRIDLAQSDNETHRTTIQTQWAELDVLQL